MVKGKILKKFMPVLLSAAMVFQSVPMTAYAEEAQSVAEVETETENESENVKDEQAENKESDEEKTDEKSAEGEAAETKTQKESEEKESSEVADNKETENSETEADENNETEKTEVAETKADTETEAETEIETETEPIVSDKEENTDNFPIKDLKVDFEGLRVKFSVNLKFEDNINRYEFYLENYDVEEKMINRSFVYWDWNNSSESNDTIDISSLYCEAATKVRLKIITYDSSNQKQGDFYSEYFNIDRSSRPEDKDISYILREQSAGKGTLSVVVAPNDKLKAQINKGNDKCIIELYGGTNEDSSTWTCLDRKWVYYESKNDNGSQVYGDTLKAIFGNLESETTYYGKIIVYLCPFVYDDDNIDSKKAFSYEINLDKFTTKKVETYKFAELFPDAVLRKYLVNRYGLRGECDTEPEYVTSALLESITSIDARVDKSTDDKIKDITGIELLINLAEVWFYGNEISDITGIDWSKLANLRSLNLDGNDLTKVPDLTKNTLLTYVSFRENMLSESEVVSAADKLPESVTESIWDSQRTGEFEFIVAPEYYLIDGKATIVGATKNVKTSYEDYKVKVYVDGEEVHCERPRDALYGFEPKAYSVGEHTIKAELLSGDTVLKSSEKKIQISEFKGMTGEDKYYVSTEDTWTRPQIIVPYKEGVTISKVEAVDDKGNVYGDNGTDTINGKLQDAVDEFLRKADVFDGLYHDINLHMYGYVAWPEIRPVKNKNKAGIYDIKVTMSDNTVYTFENTFEVISGAVITGFSLSGDYQVDSSGEYFYLLMEGLNIDGDRLEYSFSSNGKELKTEYESYRTVKDGAIAKLKKIDWNINDNKSIQVSVKAKAGYDIKINVNDNDVWISEGLYYTSYNPEKNIFEAGLSVGLGITDEIRAELKENADEKAETVASAVSRPNENGIVYLDMKNKDGNTWIPTVSKQYYLFIYYNDTYSSHWVNVEAPRASTTKYNYWDNLFNVIQQGTFENTTISYYENGYEPESQYTSKLVKRGTFEEVMSAKEVTATKGNDEGEYTVIEMKYDFNTLPVGDYTLYLYKNDIEFKYVEFYVLSNDKFYIDTYNIRWLDDLKTMQAYIRTPNFRGEDKYDDFEITLTDPYGNAVEGLSVSKVEGDEANVNVYLTGLDYSDAYKKYYVKIRHKEYGDAYNMFTKEPVFDGKGDYVSIGNYRNWYMFQWNKSVGLYVYDARFPLTLKVYMPYNATELYVCKDIKESDLLGGDAKYYHFTQDMIDHLPDVNGVYDVVLVDSDGVAVNYLLHRVLGVPTKDPIAYSLSSNRLYLGRAGYDKATLAVSNNSAAPVFESSDPEIVSVTVDSEDKNKAVLEAKGYGTANILVKTDGESRRFEITVSQYIEMTGVAFNTSTTTVTFGKTGLLDLLAIPVDAWNSNYSVAITSSDENIVKVLTTDTTGSEVAKVLLEGVAVGTATVKAEVTEKDSDKKYEATCEVTVSNQFSEEEKEEMMLSAVKCGDIIGESAKLSDVALNEHWKWKYPNTTVYPSKDSQLFEAVYNDGVHEEFSTRVLTYIDKIESVEIVGSDVLTKDYYGEYTVKIEYEYSGEYSNYSDACKNVEWTLPEGMERLTEDREPTYIRACGKAAGEKKLQATVICGSSKITVDKTIMVTSEPAVDSIDVTISNECANPINAVYKNNRIEVRADEIAAGTKDTIKLVVTAKILGNVSDHALVWSVADDKVAEITQADGQTLLKIKAEGDTTITVQADDEGKLKKRIKLVVADYAPVLDDNKLKVHMYSKGVKLPIFIKSGNEITAINVYEGDSKSANYEVKAVDGEAYIYPLKDSPVVKAAGKTDTAVKLVCITEKGEYTLPELKITQDVSKIQLKVKQTQKANVFYKNTIACFNISAKYKITNVEFIPEKADKGFALNEDSYSTNSGEYMLRLNTVGLTGDNYKDFTDKKNTAVKGKIKVSFDDIQDITQDITIQTENKPVQLSFTNVTAYGNKEIAASINKTVYSSLYDKKAKSNIYMDESYSVSLSGNANNNINEISKTVDGKLQIILKELNKAPYKTEIANTNWTQKVIAAGTVAYKEAAELQLGAKSLTLNKATNIQENGGLEVPISIKDNPVKVESIEFIATGEAATLIENGSISVTPSKDNQKIMVGINKGKGDSIKNGTYSIGIKASVNSIPQIKNATLKLVITDKAPAVKLQKKGKIVLENADYNYITYTPKFTNVQANVLNATLEGEYASNFNIYVSDGGAIKLYSLSGSKLSHKVKYPMKIKLELDNGMQMIVDDTIAVTSKNVKVKLATSKLTLYKGGNAQAVDVNVVNKAGEDFMIDNVKLKSDANSKYFTAKWNPKSRRCYEGKIQIGLSDEAKDLKPGKYTLSFDVYSMSASIDAKPTAVKVQVTVK